MSAIGTIDRDTEAVSSSIVQEYRAGLSPRDHAQYWKTPCRRISLAQVLEFGFEHSRCRRTMRHQVEIDPGKGTRGWSWREMKSGCKTHLDRAKRIERLGIRQIVGNEKKTVLFRRDLG